MSYSAMPVLVPNYKQHILLSAKLRKVCYSFSWNLCQMCLFEFILEEEARRLWNILKGGSKLYKSGGPLYWGINAVNLS
jgi:hypothetical protein